MNAYTKYRLIVFNNLGYPFIFLCNSVSINPIRGNQYLIIQNNTYVFSRDNHYTLAT